ncbi:hypothetical protein [Kitasatospora phosalacinea]|uniref:hypothetical protein n=1 Tax=Kitasatospora phosalacinea TaxID=2065 RepID=UPI00255512C0|nr:hypothetical protein [Kitasatospora phosalacinea]
MSPALPSLPIVVLPEDNTVHARTRPAEPVAAALRDAAAALRGLRTELLNPEGAGPAVDAAAAVAAERLAELAAAAWAPPLDTSVLVPIVPNHEYFGVRTAPLDDPLLVHEVATVVRRAFADLRRARLDLNDRAAIVLAMATVLERLLPGEGAPASLPVERPEAVTVPELPGQDELTRWVVTHHFYFVLNLAAAHSVSRAAQALLDRDRDTALAALAEALVYVRGFTAAMIHSGDMSAPCYDAKVRPTMQPPAVPVALTGRTQPEHKAYRQAMRRLAKIAPPFAEAFAADPELAVAVDALLEADLQDIERHIAVTAALVGDESSIVAADAAAESAVGVLRFMRHSRAVQYRELMRFGDPIALLTA